VAAALLDLPPQRVEELVDRLVDAQLLEVAGQDATGQLRYRFHDLLRAYAREQAKAEEPAPQRRAALTRALGAWLALAEEADDRFTGGSLAAGHGKATRWRANHGLADKLLADPLAWFEAERAALAAAVTQAASKGWSELAWDLASSMAGFLAMRNHFDDLRQSHEHALAAATRTGNQRGRAYMLRGLGHLAMELVRHDEASACIDRALPLFEAVGDRRGEAWAQFLVGSVERERDRHATALSWLTQAVGGFREVGDQRGEARALHAMAAVRIATGDSAGARPELKRSLAIFAAVGDHLGEAHVQSRFGVLHQALGDLEGAEAAYRAALAIYEQYGDRASAAMNIRRLGELALLRGCPQESRSLLGQALDVLREVGDRYTEALTLYSLGELDRAEGHQAAAVDAFTQALELCRTVGMPTWEARVQASLEGTRPRSSPPN
jgi:tetratricopeptide (TPR) repeat protein